VIKLHNETATEMTCGAGDIAKTAELPEYYQTDKP
jgi:hypothetical protein